jgi:4-hydroxybenzoyl-CoA thioesterase
MLVNRMPIQVDFGDCDPAGIVFYANYFRWFDRCTNALFEAAGLPVSRMFKEYSIAGVPIVDTHARFFFPSRYGDQIEAESTIVEWKTSSFVIRHHFYRDGKLLLEGLETRVWAAFDGSDSNRLKGMPIPEEVKRRLSEARSGAPNVRP